jgi:hypothetical protein
MTPIDQEMDAMIAARSDACEKILAMPAETAGDVLVKLELWSEMAAVSELFDNFDVLERDLSVIQRDLERITGRPQGNAD